MIYSWQINAGSSQLPSICAQKCALRRPFLKFPQQSQWGWNSVVPQIVLFAFTATSATFSFSTHWEPTLTSLTFKDDRKWPCKYISQVSKQPQMQPISSCARHSSLPPKLSLILRPERLFWWRYWVYQSYPWLLLLNHPPYSPVCHTFLVKPFSKPLKQCFSYLKMTYYKTSHTTRLTLGKAGGEFCSKSKGLKVLF